MLQGVSIAADGYMRHVIPLNSSCRSSRYVPPASVWFTKLYLSVRAVSREVLTSQVWVVVLYTGGSLRFRQRLLHRLQIVHNFESIFLASNAKAEWGETR